MIYRGIENGIVIYRADNPEGAACLERLVRVLKRKAEPYYRRGYTSVIQGRQIRSIEEVRDIVFDHIWNPDRDPDTVWEYATAMAGAYMLGSEAARAGHALEALSMATLKERCWA